MFFRHGAGSEKRAAARPRGSNDAQLKELRAKARRRLVGALVLVLAAVIVVPWFFQEPVTDDTHAPVVVPAAPAGLPAAPQGAAPAAGAAVPGSGPATVNNGAQGTVQAADSTQAPANAAEAGSTPPAVAEETSPRSAEPASEPSAAVASITQEPTKAAPAKAEPPKRAEPAKPVKKPVARTDDGSVALALLSGKTPSQAAAAAKPAAQGKYFLQVASYNAEQDAQSRRDSLRQAGVTDAYVERGQASGRTVYRLRVGPFGSHEAAQAAQARLRALGYQNGLISAN